MQVSRDESLLPVYGFTRFFTALPNTVGDRLKCCRQFGVMEGVGGKAIAIELESLHTEAHQFVGHAGLAIQQSCHVGPLSLLVGE